ncbi:glycosyltransferase family 92 protein RCOM_0530710 [Gastrolobium bilobum]|uniref:glycosyltransferase family 92 protein RCOM_0530710 n=1 Tax=Gastrolobium bilobum TaxID=150636 RepID=UPI002AAFE7A3|nr:glycosyltransferase family 92 protein RCOM_0530710 [Gastrolobium bilobum]
MRRRPRTTFLLSFFAILLLAAFSLHLSRNAVSSWRPHSDVDKSPRNNNNNNIVNDFNRIKRRVSSIDSKDSIPSVSVLLPDWEILVIVSPNTTLSSDEQHHCFFHNNAKSPAKYSGVLPFTNRTTFKCDMPESVRRRRIFQQPVLVTSENESTDPSPAPELMRWNFLVYESFSTEDDVVLFAKGVNHRQGYDRSPKELRCLFDLGDGVRIRKAVTSSVQEVFRCPHPDPSESGSDSVYGISLEIIGENLVVPSVAYYIPRPMTKPKPKTNSIALVSEAQSKHFLCACTMVYNVAKYLREWVMYHSKVGVENFVLYDNGSDDDLEGVIKELRAEGYNISTLLWIWPKTQEAGFSHSVLYSNSKGLCTWMMYVDVDEFVFSPSWGDGNLRDKKHEFPSLKPMLTQQESQLQRGKESTRIGQVSIRCLEFGPSGQRQHPVEGVTQGYTCRRRVEQRHKSIVLVDGVDPSLWNVIHHFKVNEKEGFRSKQLNMEEGLVNHYKYQAWDEFKGKFRRRVSAYVVDWTQSVNPKSNDRTPGLGFEAIEPKDWTQRFCEVRDQRLKSLTRAWFGSNGHRMAWQTS